MYFNFDKMDKNSHKIGEDAQFKTKLGVIWATLGSAVGLGSI